MWSSIHLAVHPVWDVAQYVVTATWRDDHEAEPVTLTRHGSAQVHTHADPLEFLAAVLSELNRQGLEVRQESGGSSVAP